MNRYLPFALLAGLAVAGCSGAPPEKPAVVFSDYGAVLMQAARDPGARQAVARMLCRKQRLHQGTRDFTRCMMKLRGHTRATQGRVRPARQPNLCTAPGDFTLAHCVEI